MYGVRSSKAYKNMTVSMAVGLAEGFEDGDEYQQLAAWQWLYDHKMYRVLQGWFGRTMQSMLDEGVLLK